MHLPWREHTDAGRSAAANYAAGVRTWRAGIRVRLVGFVAFAVVASLILWRFSEHGELAAGLTLGAILGMALMAWDTPPDGIERWRRGARGERQTAKELQPLERHRWRSYHDRAGRRGNIDHIAVGPSGVFLLESKNLRGRVRVENGSLAVRHDGMQRDAFADDELERIMRGRAVALKERIEEATGLRPWVQAVVVVWGDFPQETVESEKVAYVAGRRLGGWLLARPSKPLAERDQNLIALAIDAGYVAPPAERIAAAAGSGPPARTAS